MIRWVLLAALLPALSQARSVPVPIYPNSIRRIQIGRDLVINGELFRIVYFTTRDSPKEVVRYFHRKWFGEGYPVTVDGNVNENAIVSAFHTREGLEQSIIVRKGKHETIGFAVLKDLWVHPQERNPSGLVRLEGTLYSGEVADRHSKAEARSALVARKPSQVRTRLLERLSSRGYRLIRERPFRVDDRKARELILSRGGEKVIETLVDVDSELTMVSQQWWRTDSGGRRPEDARR